MQPFMKNVAVEYAAKALPNSELKQALDTLQQAVDSKIGFDNEVTVEYEAITGKLYLIIPNENVLGLVKVVQNSGRVGIGWIGAGGPPGGRSVTIIFEANSYYSGAGYTTDFPKRIELNLYKQGTTIYLHKISISNLNNFPVFWVFSTSADKVTTNSNFYSILSKNSSFISARAQMAGSDNPTYPIVRSSIEMSAYLKCIYISLSYPGAEPSITARHYDFDTREYVTDTTYTIDTYNDVVTAL